MSIWKLHDRQGKWPCPELARVRDILREGPLPVPCLYASLRGVCSSWSHNLARHSRSGAQYQFYWLLCARHC